MPAISKNTFSFLRKLKKNNNRVWFSKHKSEFQDAHNQFKDFVHELTEEIAGFDNSVSKALMDPKTTKIFRIYRDVRFSKDKSPYKTNFGGVISPGGMEGGNPGYYLHIDPDNSFFGGGLHMPSSKTLSKIRDKIDKDDKPIRKIISQKVFKKYFKGLETYDTLKTVPRGYDKNHRSADLLRLKSYTVFRQIQDSKVTSSNFLKECVKTAKAMKPLNDYLRSDK